MSSSLRAPHCCGLHSASMPLHCVASLGRSPSCVQYRPSNLTTLLSIRMTRRIAAVAACMGRRSRPRKGNAAGWQRGAAGGRGRVLRDEVAQLRFSPPVTHVYNPLDYAWEGHRQYLERFGRGPKRIVFLGMNPGPFGMMQTGVPFGEVAAVRDWMGIRGGHPRAAGRSTRSGRSRASTARARKSAAGACGVGRRCATAAREAFFADAFVLNYCPLVFLEASCRNRTPGATAGRRIAAALCRLRPASCGLGRGAAAALADRHRRVCARSA